MRLRTLTGLLVALAACHGPEPRDGSNADPLPIHNTAARVSNFHAVTEIADSPDAVATLAEPDRLESDRKLDAQRQAADLLTYLRIAPGMRVAELGAGGGYFTELLARGVGPSGAVFAVSPPSLTSRAARAAWKARLARPANARVVGIDHELAAPLPSEADGLDLVYCAIFYRDLPAFGVEDRRLVLASAYDALRPGGRFVVIDRATPQSARTLDLGEMHVEEARNARYEIERAGFRFESEGRFFRSSTVPNDWNATPSEHPTALETQDRFVMSFVK